MKQNRNLQDFISLFLKFILIMIFPLQFYGVTLLDLLILPATGFLFTPSGYSPMLIPEFTPIIFGFDGYIRNFLIGMIIALPGMFFNYKLTRAPVSKNYWKRGLGVAAGIFGIVFISSIFLTLYMMSPISYYNEGYYLLGQNLRFYATLVFGVFIVLPLVQRQAVIMGSPVYLHDNSMKDLESIPKLALTREKILSGILWVSLCFAPYTIGNNLYYYSGGIPLSGLMMTYYIGNSVTPIGTIGSGLLSVTVMDFTMFPFIAFMCFFQFMFVRDIYRYLRKLISRQRLVAMAVFSTIAPILLSTGLFSSMFYYMMVSFIPIPILQAVGFLIVRYHRPHAEQVDRVWEDDTHSVWWEKQEARPVPVLTTTPEKPQRHREGEIITIPMHYLFLSKLRQLHRRNRQ